MVMLSDRMGEGNVCVGMKEIIEKREKNMEEKGGGKGRKNGENKRKK